MKRGSFIEECAKYLYTKYGSAISDITILLPSRRAALFFNMELAKLIGKQAIWQPKIQSLDTIFSSLSGLTQAERLKLLVILYKVYSRYHTEPFDKFYYWGEMLLSDFEAIDNYLVDAKRLYSNSADLRDIEERFEYISEEQREEIKRFWRYFETSRNSDEKSYFINIWKTLYSIYSEFKAELLKEGIGYRGMIYRTVAESVLSEEQTIDTSVNYALIGFNALSSTEKVLFDAISKSGCGDFLWDFDNFYLNDNGNEAGLFLRQNIKRYGESNSNIVRNNYITDKNITVINSPSSSIECKYVWEFLEECAAKAAKEGKELGAETAIVLTDESLLLPVLYSIPPSVKYFNVTAGYELRLTQAYSLCESLISLKSNFNISEHSFYYKDVESVALHPLIRLNISNNDINAIDKIIEIGKAEKRIFYKLSEISQGDYLSYIFREIRGWSDFCEYIYTILDRTLSALTISGNDTTFSPETKEAIYRASLAVDELKELILSTGIELSDNIFTSALRKHLKGVRLAFHGEPLIGIQIMGILESRNLDFENLLILSVGEDNFPSKSIRSSFIPSNLRHGYSLPTLNYHEAMYSYYFYRLLQRASRIDISYVSMSGEMGSGEPSRYIHQLLYGSNHDIKRVNLSLDITTSDTTEESVAKDKLSREYLQLLKSGNKMLSASSLSNYIVCPKKFYYSTVLRLKESEEEREGDMGAVDIGNVTHHVVETIYKPLIGLSHETTIERLKMVSNDYIDQQIEVEISKLPLSTDKLAAAKNNRRFIASYVRSVVNYDISRSDGYAVEAIESDVTGHIDICGNNIGFFGKIDRIDRLSSGATQIIDYKSGSVIKEISSIEELFDSEKSHNKAIMQTLLYSHIKGNNCVPSIYDMKGMHKSGFTPYLTVKEYGKINRYEGVKEDFILSLTEKLNELINEEIPFYKTQLNKNCEYCTFNSLCEL